MEIFKISDNKIIIIGLLVFVVTAVFSHGYFHPDEHYQILEFAGYKLGLSPASDLPWEFDAKIRPAIQPALAYLVIKTMNIFSIFDPFTYALVLRLITSILFWLVITNLCLYFLNDFKSAGGKKMYLLMNYFLWFIPFISVRFSSEAYSAISFFGAVYLILKSKELTEVKKNLNLLFAGLLLGFSFYFRFQMGFAIIGLGLWLLFIDRIKLPKLSLIILFGVLALYCSYLIDQWFYQTPVLTPYNYFYSNIIQGKAASFGTEPWWYYFTSYINNGFPPSSFILLILFFLGIYLKPKSVMTWVVIPFIIGHLLVSHKELRFMFPITIGFLYLSSISLDHFLFGERKTKGLLMLLKILMILNIPPLIFNMYTPPQEELLAIKEINAMGKSKPSNIICIEKDVYHMSLHLNFYKSPKIKSLVFKDIQTAQEFIHQNQPLEFLFLERKFLNDSNFEGYKKELVYCFFPKWIKLFDFGGWLERSNGWKVEKFKRIP